MRIVLFLKVLSPSLASGWVVSRAAVRVGTIAGSRVRPFRTTTFGRFFQVFPSWTLKKSGACDEVLWSCWVSCVPVWSLTGSFPRLDFEFFFLFVFRINLTRMFVLYFSSQLNFCTLANCMNRTLFIYIYIFFKFDKIEVL